MEDLIKILEQRPEWREQLLQALLTDKFLQLPARVDRLEAAVIQLTEQVQELTKQMQALTERVDKLTERVDKLTATVEEMAKIQRGMVDDVGYLKGRDREHFYRENASAIFGRYLQKVKVMNKGKLLERMNAAKALTDDEWREIVDLDLAVEAVARKTSRQLILAMEVSWVINGGDVERAVRRAALMRECGLPAIPVVAGNGLLPGAKDSAKDHQVLVVLDGRIFDKEFLVKGTMTEL
jgi:outer membrane murein-binding lipoprotein Lpp